MVCELLLENGADPLAETRNGVSPLYAASKNGHKNTVKILLKFGADSTKTCAEVSIILYTCLCTQENATKEYQYYT